jgi:hypothetical protein
VPVASPICALSPGLTAASAYAGGEYTCGGNERSGEGTRRSTELRRQHDDDQGDHNAGQKETEHPDRSRYKVGT